MFLKKGTLDEQPQKKRKLRTEDDTEDCHYIEWCFSHKGINDLRSINIENNAQQNRIKSLDLSNNYIISVSEDDLYHLLLSSSWTLMAKRTYPHLIKLNLAANNLTSFPSLSPLPNLQFLQLSNNKITHMPQELLQCEQLQVLDLRFNRIEKVEHLENCVHLRKLTLSSNKLSDLHGFPANRLSSLEFLGLFGNRFQDLYQSGIYSALKQLKLKCLFLSGNPFYPVKMIPANREAVAVYQEDNVNNIHKRLEAAILQALPDLMWLNDEYVINTQQCECSSIGSGNIPSLTYSIQ